VQRQQKETKKQQTNNYIKTVSSSHSVHVWPQIELRLSMNFVKNFRLRLKSRLDPGPDIKRDTASIRVQYRQILC